MWKLLDARSFQLMMQVQLGEKKKIDFIKSTANLRGSLVLITSIVRSFFIAAGLYFFMFHLEWKNDLVALDIFHSPSLLRQLFESTVTEFGLFFPALWLYVIVLFALKWILIHFFALVFNLKDIAARIFLIESAAAFPWLSYVVAAFFLIAVLPAQQRTIIFGVALFLVAVYWLNRLGLVLSTFSGLLKLPAIVIFLYICALELLPWLILL
jgi:hypothetical protein